jgi:hypothetical protein
MRNIFAIVSAYYITSVTSCCGAHRTKDFRRFIPFLFMYGLHPRHPFVRCSEIVVAMQWCLRLCLHCIGSVFVSFAKSYGPSVNSFRPRPSMLSYFLLYIIRIVSCCLPDSILSHALNRNCSEWCLHYNESVAKTDPIHRAPLRRANRRTTGSLQKLRR